MEIGVVEKVNKRGPVVLITSHKIRNAGITISILADDLRDAGLRYSSDGFLTYLGRCHDGRRTGGTTHAGAVVVVVGPPDYLAQSIPTAVDQFSEWVVVSDVLNFLLNFVYKFRDLGGECSGEGLGLGADRADLGLGIGSELANLCLGVADESIKDFKNFLVVEIWNEISELVNGILLYFVDYSNRNIIDFVNQFLAT